MKLTKQQFIKRVEEITGYKQADTKDGYEFSFTNEHNRRGLWELSLNISRSDVQFVKKSYYHYPEDISVNIFISLGEAIKEYYETN